MSPAVRNLISRGTLLVVAVTLLYSGIFCINKARQLYRDEAQRVASLPNQKTNGGFGLIGTIGAILCLGGIVTTFGAVAPNSLIERVLGRPNNTTLHENPETWPIDMID
jgi:hypothetical protein